MTLDPALSLVAALGLALLLAAAGVHKLRDWVRFRGTLADYRVLPAALVPLAAALVPALELAAAATLPFAATRTPAALLAAALLVVYGAAIALNLARGRTSLDCGCFGSGARARIARWMVWRNGVLALAALAAALPVGARELAAIDALTIGGATLAFVVLYLAGSTLGTVASRAGDAA